MKHYSFQAVAAVVLLASLATAAASTTQRVPAACFATAKQQCAYAATASDVMACLRSASSLPASCEHALAMNTHGHQQRHLLFENVKKCGPENCPLDCTQPQHAGPIFGASCNTVADCPQDGNTYVCGTSAVVKQCTGFQIAEDIMGGLRLARAGNGPLFNPDVENGGNIANCATDPRPSDTVWHWGYCHDGDVVMEPLLSVLNCEVGCRITQGPLCMLDTATNQQFDVTFTTWGSGQGTCPGAYRYEISVYPPNSVCVMQPYFLQLQ